MLHFLKWFSILLFLLLNFSHAQELKRYTFSHQQMGTTFNLILYTTHDSLANKASVAVFHRIDELNQIMSDYIPDSELNQLVKHAGEPEFILLSHDLWTVVQHSQIISRKSKGTFDITVGPLSRLWRRAFRRKEIPEKSKIEAAKKLVNYRYIKLREKDHSIQLKREGMKLDLGGIAKGYAVDEAIKALEELGIEIALVDGGGDIRIGHSPPNKKGWEIEISGLDNQQKIEKRTRLLSNCAIATSGDIYRFVEANGKRYSHIINPKTGWGITSRRLVTVITPTCTNADALASVVSIAGKKQGHKIAKKILQGKEYNIEEFSQ